MSIISDARQIMADFREQWNEMQPGQTARRIDLYARLGKLAETHLPSMADEIERLRAENAELRDRLMRETSGDPRTFGGF